MNIIGWILRRAIRQMFATYLAARAQRATHRDALWAVVLSRFPKEPNRATAFWHNHWRLEAEHPSMVMPDENQEEAELKVIVHFLLLNHGSEPSGVNYTRQINEIYDNEIKAGT